MGGYKTYVYVIGECCQVGFVLGGVVGIGDDTRGCEEEIASVWHRNENTTILAFSGIF